MICHWLMWIAAALNLGSAVYCWWEGRAWRQLQTQYQQYVERLEAVVDQYEEGEHL